MRKQPELRGRAARLARLLPTGSAQAARTPFVLLIVTLLGGGLLVLLLLNSAVSEGSFELGDLRGDTKDLTDEEQALQRDVDAYSAPDALARRAHDLGMVPGGDPAFLSPDGTVKGVPTSAPGRPVTPPEAAGPVDPVNPVATTAPAAPTATTAPATSTRSDAPLVLAPGTAGTPQPGSSPTPGR